MAGKKRTSRSAELSESESGDGSDGDGAPATLQKSVKPMERRKKRKELDKARHSAAAEGEKPPKPKAESSAVRGPGGQAPPSAHGGGLPVHLFMDLTSLESSVREAAAEGLATELRKSQEEFERFGGEHRDSGRGAVPLEAEKNDGLDNCAPPVRYAVRRLIRGLASSREVRSEASGKSLGDSILLIFLISLLVASPENGMTHYLVCASEKHLCVAILNMLPQCALPLGH